MSLVERAVERMRKAAAAAAVATDVAAKEPRVETADKMADSPGTPSHSNPRMVIDTKSLRERGYLPQESRDRAFADHYRQIKRPLITRATASVAAGQGGGDPRVIMITSALPGDGKSFTSINLGLSIARERDVSLLLIDADIAKAHISEIFELRQKPGLTDALLDDRLAVESLVIPTDVRGLSVLPAGRSVDGITELLTSDRMRQVLANLTKQNTRRILLLDSAPLLITSEARALTALVGQVVMVVRSGQTPRRAMQDALKLIDEQRAGGIILNEARVGIGEGYYGYGYGYGSNGAERDDSSPNG